MQGVNDTVIALVSTAFAFAAGAIVATYGRAFLSLMAVPILLLTAAVHWFQHKNSGHALEMQQTGHNHGFLGHRIFTPQCRQNLYLEFLKPGGEGSPPTTPPQCWHFNRPNARVMGIVERKKMNTATTPCIFNAKRVFPTTIGDANSIILSNHEFLL